MMIFERRISRRQLMTGAAGVGAAAALGGGLVYAQNATQSSTPAAGTSGSAATTTTTNAQKRYTDFVDKLAVNLGNLEPAKVDAAIRTTLKQMVDEAYQAGNISAKEATAIKNRIDASNFPADLAPLFRGRFAQGVRRRRLQGGGGVFRPGRNKNNKGTQPANNATPAATPSTT